MKPSSLPYTTDNRTQHKGADYTVLLDANGKVIADCLNSDVAEIETEWDDIDGEAWNRKWDAQGKADLEFLAHAANLYTRLVKACQDAYDTIRRADCSNGVTTCSGDSDEGDVHASRVLDDLAAVIREAKEGNK